MKKPQPSAPMPFNSPFQETEPEMFPKGLPCRVTSAVRVLDTGRVKANGRSWLAELYELNCSTTLLPDQPALSNWTQRQHPHCHSAALFALAAVSRRLRSVA